MKLLRETERTKRVQAALKLLNERRAKKKRERELMEAAEANADRAFYVPGSRATLH